MERAWIEPATAPKVLTAPSTGPFALCGGSRLAAAHIEASLKLAERFPDELRRRETRLRLQAAAAFLGIEIYPCVKVDTWLRGGGHMKRLLIGCVHAARF